MPERDFATQCPNCSAMVMPKDAHRCIKTEPITAEQLAARKHHSITVLGERCYIWAVTQAEHELILAALREHEVRAAVCDPDDPDKAEQYQKFWSKVVSDHQDNPLSVGDAYRLKMRLLNERFGLFTAKAAAEKVATSSLVRCDCVDANGNAWPDCTCDHGWRQAAVEKAVRNG